MRDFCRLLDIELQGGPADVYRVLRLKPLESDGDLIRLAIERTRERLRAYEGGSLDADCRKVQALLRQSESILNDPVRKSCFDKILRSDPHGHSDETAEGTGGAGPAVVRADRDGPGPLPRPAPDGAAPVEGRNARFYLAISVLAASLAIGGRQLSSGPMRFPKSRSELARAGGGLPTVVRPRPAPARPLIPDLPLGKPLKIPGLEGTDPAYSPTFSPDLKVVVLSRFTGTRGGYDLVTADRDDIRKPFANLRPVKGCDTAESETCPALSPDLLELVFVRSDRTRNLGSLLVHARRDSADADFQEARAFETSGLFNKPMRLDTPQWVDEGRGLLYLAVNIDASSQGDRHYLLSKRDGRTQALERPATLPLSNPWPLTFLSADSLHAYHVTERGVLVSSRATTKEPFGPLLIDPLLTSERLGPVDGPVWVSPEEDVLFYCSPGVGKKIGHGRFLWLVRFR